MSTLHPYTFHWADYLLFSLSFVVTIVVGVVVAVRDRWHQQTSESYLMAGRNMNWFLVAISVLASAMSATMFVGLTTEFYYMGVLFMWASIGLMLGAAFTAVFTIPKFFRLGFQVTSAYEYFQKRYNLPVRMLCGFIYVTFTLLYMAVMLYVPSLVFSQVSGLDVRICITIGAVVCIIYTGFGGMKAVIWVDNIQMTIITIGLLTMAIKGIVEGGGFSAVWERYEAGYRNVWNDIDPRPWNRHTVWGCVFLFAVNMAGYFSTHQMLLQRYMTVPKMKMSQLSVVLGCFVCCILLVFVLFLGMGAFTHLGGNEPLVTGHISKPDQIFPLYMMEILGTTHGVPGLVVAALFAAALSSLSSGQNAMAAVFLEDIFRPIHRIRTGRDLNEKARGIVSRVTGVVTGLLTLALGLTVPYFDDYIYSLTRSAESFITGPILGVMICGFFLSYTESWGVFVGCILSVIWGLQQYIGSLKMGTKIGFDQPPIYLKNFTLEVTIKPPAGPPTLYDVSYMWYILIDALIVIITASIISPIVHCVRNKGSFTFKSIRPDDNYRYTMEDLRISLGISTEGAHQVNVLEAVSDPEVMTPLKPYSDPEVMTPLKPYTSSDPENDGHGERTQEKLTKDSAENAENAIRLITTEQTSCEVETLNNFQNCVIRC